MATVNLTLRIDEDIKKRLEEVAKADERSLSFIAGKALAEYLDNHAPTKKK